MDNSTPQVKESCRKHAPEVSILTLVYLFNLNLTNAAAFNWSGLKCGHVGHPNFIVTVQEAMN